MKAEIIQSLIETFEGHAQQTDGGVEYWLARDLQHLLGYGEWRNFNTVIFKAKTACEISGHPVVDHFVDVNKMVDLGSGSQREIEDLMLTRYACYLIAQNGDSRKSEIAFAQTYFAIQTRGGRSPRRRQTVWMVGGIDHRHDHRRPPSARWPLQVVPSQRTLTPMPPARANSSATAPPSSRMMPPRRPRPRMFK